jgi:DNA-binding MarR family transcriptional regulator
VFAEPSDEEYERLLAFRTRLRLFELCSRAAAEAQGLTHTQHQLLLAVRGHSADGGPTVGDVAGSLHVKHHTASELAARVEGMGLLERVRGDGDRRAVRLRLTKQGHQILNELTAHHLEELRRLAPLLGDI